MVEVTRSHGLIKRRYTVIELLRNAYSIRVNRMWLGVIGCTGEDTVQNVIAEKAIKLE